jgi:hypothetical protein
MACDMVMEELGFKNKTESGNCMVVHEEEQNAINIIEEY